MGAHTGFVNDPLRVSVACVPQMELVDDAMALSPITKAAALHGLANKALNLDALKSEALTGLARLTQSARCYRLAPIRSRALIDAVSALI